MSPSAASEPRLTRLSELRRPVAGRMIGFLAAFCVLLVCFHAWSLWHARTSDLDEAAVSTANMARALAAQAETSLKVGSVILADMVERTERDGAVGGPAQRLQARLAAIVRHTEEVHGLFVYGANGDWLVTSLPGPMQGNNADRDYFRYHLTHADRTTRVGKPIRSRSTGAWIIPLSRRIDRPDGSFGGVALVTLDIGYFGKFYDRFDIGRSGTIFLATDDGALIYRRPYKESLVGMDINNGPVFEMLRKTGPAGTALLRSRLDGVERLYSYRHLDGFPLVVASAQAKDELLARWALLALKSSAAMLAVLLMLAWGGMRMVRQVRIRDKLEQELRRMGSALQEHNVSLQAQAESDGLTGLANRRLFGQTLVREHARARRSGGAFSVIMSDVDFFKKYNDRYGHVAGDDCLRKVAGAIAAGARRPPDLAARYGGEEFALILPDTDAAGALAVAAAIRAAVAELGLEHADGYAGRVSVSVGAYTCYPQQAPDQDAMACVDCADALLYEAKAGGRDRVVARAAAEWMPAPAPGWASSSERKASGCMGLPIR
jgi:diguanylate cyclase (GGDEF)-like protein